MPNNLLEELLESVAQQIDRYDGDTLDVLRRKFLPLLEAGEAMQKLCPWKTDRDRWDAALKAALEQK